MLAVAATDVAVVRYDELPVGNDCDDDGDYDDYDDDDDHEYDYDDDGDDLHDIVLAVGRAKADRKHSYAYRACISFW